MTEQDDTSRLSEAAKILGRKGGLKGGPARARALSAEDRSEIARDAAFARWDEKYHLSNCPHCGEESSFDVRSGVCVACTVFRKSYPRKQ